MVYQGQKTHTVKLFATKVTQPGRAATPEEADTRHRRASASSGFCLPKCEMRDKPPCNDKSEALCFGV